MSAIRTLRKALNMSQQDLAAALDMSIGSIRAYEAGQRPSESAIEKLKTLAASRGHPEIAFELDPREFAARKVFSAGQAVKLSAHPLGSDLAEQLRADLEVILESGRPDLIIMLETVLNLAKLAVK